MPAAAYGDDRVLKALHHKELMGSVIRNCSGMVIIFYM